MNYRLPIIELYTPGNAVTARAATAITKGAFVAVTTGTDAELVTITTAPAGARPFGIAHLAAGENTLVGIQRGPGRCFRVPVNGALVAGDEVQVGADGKATKHTDGVVVGVALRASNGEEADITLV